MCIINNIYCCRRAVMLWASMSLEEIQRSPPDFSLLPSNHICVWHTWFSCNAPSDSEFIYPYYTITTKASGKHVPPQLITHYSSFLHFFYPQLSTQKKILLSIYKANHPSKLLCKYKLEAFFSKERDLPLRSLRLRTVTIASSLGETLLF